MDSQDRERHRKDNKKHPTTDPFPHPPHRVQHKPILPKDHDPHTKPDPNDESINHGVYEDRPRPSKINKRNLKLPSKI